MPRCPFAVWKPISGSSGPNLGGPFKIVHHTTEGSTAEDAMQAFANNRSDPHFTVDAKHIYQHIDTQEGARALRNLTGGVPTNRDSAIQIELVCFAHLPKDRGALANVARLCRWIEAAHCVPKEWPSGFPKPAKNGRDPGGHNRNAQIWDTKAGHYGHCHVPENTHWDPGYTVEEVQFLMDAAFDEDGRLVQSPEIKEMKRSVGGAKDRGAKGKAAKLSKGLASVSTMPDHDIVPTGFAAYLGDLPVRAARKPEGIEASKPRKKLARALADPAQAGTGSAMVDGGSLVSFVEGINEEEMQDILYSVQIAQRGASGFFDRFTQTQAWYQKYIEILVNLGWTSEQLMFSHYDQSQGEFRMDQAALAIIAAIATQNQLAVLQQSVAALSKVADTDGTIRLFDFHSVEQDSGNFQIGAVQRSLNGGLAMALGAFYFRSMDSRKHFLFFKWGEQSVNFWAAAQRMTLNREFYAKRRSAVIAKLGTDADDYLATLPIGKP